MNKATAEQYARCKKLLVVIPNWVGDVVMVTPMLAVLREAFADAHITYLMRPYVAEILADCDWHDDELYWPMGKGLKREWAHVDLIRQLKQNRHDLAVLLTNSMRSALVTKLAGIPNRVGYARDGRGWLLSDKLYPLKWHRKFVPVPMLPYYSAIVERVGAPVSDLRLRLAATPEQEAKGESLKSHYGLKPGSYAVINPGAAFGAAKCWLPERFAEVCDGLAERFSLTPVIVGAPGEVPLMRAIAEKAKSAVVLENPGTTLGSLKSVMRDAAVLVCNDTGPRHYGIAFGVPTVTIFGPTSQEWTDTDCPYEIKLQALVDCGPCQLKKCPLDLRCMKRVTSDMVLNAVETLLDARRCNTGECA